ncbi:unnamed protein product [Parnassius mnemosyne]|uniref:Uncharacterized protein n=1 Tax=Parnassius mnemosyne TaxID=213953 RepID=A0AAV1KCS0_9NEOP
MKLDFTFLKKIDHFMNISLGLDQHRMEEIAMQFVIIVGGELADKLHKILNVKSLYHSCHLNLPLHLPLPLHLHLPVCQIKDPLNRPLSIYLITRELLVHHDTAFMLTVVMHPCI